MYILTEVGRSMYVCMYVCSMDGVAFPFPERLYGGTLLYIGKVRCVTAAWVCILYVYILYVITYIIVIGRYGANVRCYGRSSCRESV